MSHYIFAPQPVVAAPVRGSDALFPIGRIFCVGRNYAAHAREMGTEPDREAPFYFNKAASAYAASGSTIAYPPMTENYHYEMELVVAIGSAAHRVPAGHALSAVFGYACGLDMTRRDLQLRCRERGRPWDVGKDFEQSAVLSPIARAEDVGHPSDGIIELRVNGQTRQSSTLDQLIHPVPNILADLSQYYHLQPGDLIYTGTPEGVGPVQRGDRLEGSIAGIGRISVIIGP